MEASAGAKNIEAVIDIISSDNEDDLNLLNDNAVSTEGTGSEESAGGSKKIRKKAFRFTAAADIDLLKEVFTIQPFKADSISNAWMEVAKNCGNKYSSECARKRYNLLLIDFKKQNVKKLKQSGTTEEFGEKEKLLQDIADVLMEMKDDKRAKIISKDSSKNIGEAIREAAMSTLAESPGVSKESKAPKRRTPHEDELNHKTRLLDLMEKRLEEESAARKVAQELEAKKLELEQARIDQANEQMKLIFKLFEHKQSEK